MKALEKQIAQVISRHRLLPQGKERPVLVALSGGADSVALLRLLLRLGYTCHAAHCNFHLRGDESERDELFVRQLCQRLGVTLHVQDFATADYAAAHKVSIEMAARQLRYDWFKRLRAETGCQAVAVAHHRDDNVETLLLNLLRGSGLHGLTGMDYRRDGIVRPLLDVSRQQLTGYLGKLGQDYVTDSTNLQPDVRRNRLRLQVLPLLRQLNPAADDTLQATIERLREADRLVSDSVSQAIADTVATHDDGTESLDINKLQQFAAPQLTLFHWLDRHGFNPTQADEVWQQVQAGNLRTGALWHSPAHMLLADRGRLLLQARADSDEDYFTLAEEPFNDPSQIARQPWEATLDADRVTLPLTARPLQRGDRFQPYGMRGSKLVSDFLTDLKLSRFDRQRQRALCDATGRIVWLPGLRTDQRCAVRPDRTTRLLRIRWHTGEH